MSNIQGRQIGTRLGVVGRSDAVVALSKNVPVVKSLLSSDL